MRYRCTLSDTGLDDLVVPMRSFQIRYRQSPRQCYVQAVIPKGVYYAEEIITLKNGEITITEIADDDTETELLAANIDTIRLDEGAINRSVSIVGYKQVTWPATGSYDVPHVTYLAGDRVRAQPVTGLRPGDDATAAGETFAADEIVWSVSPRRRVMEVSGRVPRMNQIRLAAAGHIGLTADPMLRPSAMPLVADGLIDADFEAPMPARLQADATVDLTASGHIVVPTFLEADAGMDLYAIADLASGSMPAYIESLNPVGYWRMTEDLTTFPNLGTLGSGYDLVREIKTGSTNKEANWDTQHAACVPALPGDKGLWTQYYWHLILPSGFSDLTGDFTILFWCIPETDVTAVDVFFREQSASTALALKVVARTNRAEFSYSNAGGVGDILLGTSALSSQEFVVARAGLGDAELIINNVVEDIGTQTTLHSQAGKVPYVLSQGAGDWGFYGTIQDFAIFDRDLTDSEISTIYTLGGGT